MDTSSIELLTQKEAAELLHIKLETLKQWRKKGMISYRKTGRFVQFAREDIEEFIRGNKTRGGEK